MQEQTPQQTIVETHSNIHSFMRNLDAMSLSCTWMTCIRPQQLVTHLNIKHSEGVSGMLGQAGNCAMVSGYGQ